MQDIPSCQAALEPIKTESPSNVNLRSRSFSQNSSNLFKKNVGSGAANAVAALTSQFPTRNDKTNLDQNNFRESGSQVI